MILEQKPCGLEGAERCVENVTHCDACCAVSETRAARGTAGASRVPQEQSRQEQESLSPEGPLCTSHCGGRLTDRSHPSAPFTESSLGRLSVDGRGGILSQKGEVTALSLLCDHVTPEAPWLSGPGARHLHNGALLPSDLARLTGQ